MRRPVLAIILLVLGCNCCLAQRSEPTFKKLTLSTKFYAEGAYYGDFNRDGKLDVVAGPYWFEGPDFTKRHEYREAKAFDPKGYSDNFLTYVGDFNGDGWPDVLCIGYPGSAAYWYENPRGKEGHWKKHLALENVENESPMLVDLKGDGRRELLYNTGGSLGYATFDPAKPEKPWVFHPITPKGNYHRYTHGIGLGDIKGDGRIDILEKDGWWSSRPARGDGLWTLHPFKFAEEARRCSSTTWTATGSTTSSPSGTATITVWSGTSSFAPPGRDHLAAARDPAPARTCTPAACGSARCTPWTWLTSTATG